MKPTFFAKAKGRVGEIYLYGDIGGFDGINAIDVTDALKGIGQVDELNCYVNSPGGSVFEGIAIYNQFARYPAKKNMYIDSLAASIASVICMAGDRIIMGKGSEMMIHEALGISGGYASDFRKMADTLDKITADINGIYAKRTKQSPDQIAQWMTAETWMRAPEAMQLGFVDQIDDTDKIINAAFPMLATYKNTPKHLLEAATRPNVLLAKMNQRAMNISRPAAKQ